MKKQKKQRVIIRKVPNLTPQARLERRLGRKLLSGQIPVVQGSQMATCPVPSSHVRNFDECCRDYEAGKITEAEVMNRVNEILKGIKKQ